MLSGTYRLLHSRIHDANIYIRMIKISSFGKLHRYNVNLNRIQFYDWLWSGGRQFSDTFTIVTYLSKAKKMLVFESKFNLSSIYRVTISLVTYTNISQRTGKTFIHVMQVNLTMKDTFEQTVIIGIGRSGIYIFMVQFTTFDRSQRVRGL